MIIKIHPSTLGTALDHVARVLATKPAVPIFDGVLMEASEDGTLTLTCSDGELTATQEIGAEVIEPGRACMPGKLLLGVVKKLPDAAMRMETDDRCAAKIRCNGNNTRIQGHDPEHYPGRGNALGEIQVAEAPTAVLKRMLVRTRHAIGNDASRVALTGAYLELEPRGEIKVTTLDGFQMAHIEDRLSQGPKEPIHAILPGRAVGELCKLLPDGDTMARIEHTGNRMRFTIGNATLDSALIGGEYIDYTRVTPKTHKTEARVARKELEGAISRAEMLMVAGMALRLSITEEYIEIKVASQQGDMTECVTIQGYGDTLDIAFSSGLLRNALCAYQEDELTLEFGTPTSPCVVTAPGTARQTCIVLPVRVKT